MSLDPKHFYTAMTDDERDEYQRWRRTLSVREDTCGGRACFPGTRLEVVRVGHLVWALPRHELLEAYPYLTEQDFWFAQMFVEIGDSVV